MLEYYFVALCSLGQTPDLAHSALPDAPVRPESEGRRTGRTRRSQEPASPTETAEAAPPAKAAPPAAPAVAAGPNESTTWDPCSCRQWGVCREDRHGCVAMCKELFPELDQELDAWEAEHGWLYR